MDDDARRVLGQLLERPAAALATLHAGAPAVSLAPFVFLPQRGVFVVLVSGLAAHTHDMRSDERVGLLLAQADSESVPAQALARVSVGAEAVEVEADSPARAELRAAYLAKYPSAAMLFELPDFTFFVLRPTSVRLVAGFARALSLQPEDLCAAVRR